MRHAQSLKCSLEHNYKRDKWACDESMQALEGEAWVTWE
jgi:hypothetical protein